jgi:predicted DNA-binding antitoxin AbrB/MazE fold protein
MVETVDAIYENGIFKPLKDIHISSGQKVKLIIEIDDEESVKDILKSATDVYDGLSDDDISDIEKIAFNRNEFF